MKNLQTDRQPQLVSLLRDIARPLHYESHLDPLVKAVENKRFVLLGEASHGTSEFYLWRSAITKRIIENQNVTFIAVEGDWPDCYLVNRYVKGYKDSGKNAEEVLRQFSRWPTWMWANEEMIDIIEWLKAYNQELNPDKRIGFYGMDIYSLWESMQAVIRYLDKADPQAADQAKEMYECFEPYGGNSDRYALSTAYVPEGCMDEVIQVLTNLQKNLHFYPGDREEKFNAEQNAYVVKRAEEYYRSMLSGNVQSWNNRDRSMVDTLYRLVDFYGPSQTAIVWAHNTHVGDARFTDMALEGMWNVGELLRQEIGEEYVFSVGFSTYQGNVIAGKMWDAPMEAMKVPPAKEGSWDFLLHQIDTQNKLYIFPRGSTSSSLFSTHGQRAIGVVYNPLYERGNYVPTVLGARFDSLLYIDTTHALHPLHVSIAPEKEVPETYPSAL